MIVQNTTNSK